MWQLIAMSLVDPMYSKSQSGMKRKQEQNPEEHVHNDKKRLREQKDSSVFGSIPPELVKERIVLPHLQPKDILSLALTSKELHSLTLHPSVWKELFMRYFGDSVSDTEEDSDEGWKEKFMKNWIPYIAVRQTSGGNTQRSFCYPACLAPTLQGGKEPSFVLSKPLAGNPDHSYSVYSINGNSIFTSSLKGGESWFGSKKKVHTIIFSRFDLLTAQLLWEYEYESSHMYLGCSVHGSRVYISNSDLSVVDLHVISLENGEFVGKVEVLDERRAGFPPRQDPLVIGENLVLLVDTKGSLLGFDCSSLSADRPQPQLVFTIECGDCVPKKKFGALRQAVTLIDGDKTAVWIFADHLLVADIPSRRLVSKLNLNEIAKIALVKGGRKLKYATDYHFTSLGFDKEKAYGILLSPDFGSPVGCVAFKLRKEERNAEQEDKEEKQRGNDGSDKMKEKEKEGEKDNQNKGREKTDNANEEKKMAKDKEEQEKEKEKEREKEKEKEEKIDESLVHLVVWQNFFKEEGGMEDNAEVPPLVVDGKVICYYYYGFGICDSGSVQAYDSSSGKLLWSVGFQSGRVDDVNRKSPLPMMVVGNILLCGVMNLCSNVQVLQGIDVRTGREKWEIRRKVEYESDCVTSMLPSDNLLMLVGSSLFRKRRQDEMTNRIAFLTFHPELFKEMPEIPWNEEDEEEEL